MVRCKVIDALMPLKQMGCAKSDNVSVCERNLNETEHDSLSIERRLASRRRRPVIDRSGDPLEQIYLTQ